MGGGGQITVGQVTNAEIFGQVTYTYSLVPEPSAALTEAHLVNGDLETAQRRVDETLQTADQFEEHGIKVRALR